MKNITNTRITRTRLVRTLGTQSLRLCAAALAAVIVITMAACDTPASSGGGGGSSGGSKSISGTATAGSIGAGNTGVWFNRTGSFVNVPSESIKMTITTDLPPPNNSFVHGYSSDWDGEITGLTDGQKVNWTATVPGGTITDYSKPDAPQTVHIYWEWSPGK